jgi:hypothetical protein
MQFTLATLAALAAASIVSAAPTSAGSPPSGCSTSYSGTFEITVSLPKKKRDIEEVNREEVILIKGNKLTQSSVKLHVVPELSWPH